MIHILIKVLHNCLPFPQWLFLLAAYEHSPTDWIERRHLLESLPISDKPSTLIPLTTALEQLNLIETDKVRTGPSITSCRIRLTAHGRAQVKAAFKVAAAASKAAKATPVPA